MMFRVRIRSTNLHIPQSKPIWISVSLALLLALWFLMSRGGFKRNCNVWSEQTRFKRAV